MKLLILVIALCVMGCESEQATSVSTNNPNVERSVEIVMVSDVKWEKLNPARGDKSPQAGTLWGDRKGTVPTGCLVKFVEGFSSPPHIHNVTYRGVVIDGLIHNDDPDAAHMWMPKGSFWTQPKGEIHITAAKGKTNIAYIEIDNGPYLILPKDKVFDSGERPINVDVSNIVWLDYPKRKYSGMGVKQAFLWGSLKKDKLNGSFIKLPAGFKGIIRSGSSIFRAVIIKGKAVYTLSNNSGTRILFPGSYFGSKKEIGSCNIV